MRPQDLKTKIFLDSADPEETRKIMKLMGFLDGQTTNPTLFSRNPDVQARFDDEGHLSKLDLYEMYQEVAEEIFKIIPKGSVSIEVYADNKTLASAMLAEALELNEWIPNAHIKFPVTPAGLAAAAKAVLKGINVNITLVFSQEQAAAVYAATLGAKPGQVFISPFVGRLDDQGERGMDLVENIIKMYKNSDGHVQVLTASVRTYHHFNKALDLQSDIITAPYDILKHWAEIGLPNKIMDYKSELKAIKYHEIDLNKNWQSYNLKHQLTTVGVEKFAKDWNNLIKN